MFTGGAAGVVTVQAANKNAAAPSQPIRYARLVAYRDELEAAQARAESLERELAHARSELAVVRGGESQALARRGATELARSGGALQRSTDDGKAARRWLGAPTLLTYSRTVEGEIPESSYTELVETMRDSLRSVGTTTVLPGSLAWATMAQQNGVAPTVNIYITARDGQTKIRAEQKLGNLAGGIFGGVGGGLGGGGIMAPIAVAWVAPVLVPLALVAWLGGTYAGCRVLYRSRARKHADKLEALLEDLAAIAARQIARAQEQATADADET